MWMGPQRTSLDGREDLSVGTKATGACGSSSQGTVARAGSECPTLKPQAEWGDLTKGLSSAQRKAGTLG